MKVFLNATARCVFVFAARLAVVAALCLSCLSSPRASAQQVPEKTAGGTVAGKVRDENGAGIVGVALRLELEPKDPSPRSRYDINGTTDAMGRYSLAAPAGRYVLRAKRNGFRELVVNDIGLNQGETRQLDLVLKVECMDCGGGLPPAEPTTDSAMPPPEFSDKPNFTVAGVTDRSNLGLHGSDANVRTNDALTKETAALKSGEDAKSAGVAGAGDVRRAAGDAKEKSGDPVGAEKEYEAAVKLDPSEENYFAWGAELLLYRAGPAAVQVFAKGSELHPLSARLRAALGAAYYADGQFTEAATQMCRASDVNPSDAQPYLFLGRMEKAAAEPFPCSEERLKRFVEHQPGNALAHYNYALVLWKKARKAQDAAGLSAAEGHLQRAAELDSSLGEAYLQLGLLYNARGQREDALWQFKQAVAASPALGAAHYQLSLAYRRSGNAAQADAEMEKYQELRRSEDAQLEKERRELRQFVTVMKDTPTQKH